MSLSSASGSQKAGESQEKLGERSATRKPSILSDKQYQNVVKTVIENASVKELERVESFQTFNGTSLNDILGSSTHSDDTTACRPATTTQPSHAVIADEATINIQR